MDGTSAATAIILWDWCHLGQDDLLNALLGHLTGDAHKPQAAGYHWAMELADRDPAGDPVT